METSRTRPRIALAALALALALGTGSCPGESRREPPKHVLLLVIDTQRADHLGC